MIRQLAVALAGLALLNISPQQTQSPARFSIDITLHIQIDFTFTTPEPEWIPPPSSTPAPTWTATPDPEPTPTQEVIRFVCVSGFQGVNVRSSDAINPANVIGQLRFGQRVQLLESQDQWLKIQYNGQSAYVYARLMLSC